MMTLGMVLAKLLGDNPSIVIMATEDIKKGELTEVNGVKIAKAGDREIIVLTI